MTNLSTATDNGRDKELIAAASQRLRMISGGTQFETGLRHTQLQAAPERTAHASVDQRAIADFLLQTASYFQGLRDHPDVFGVGPGDFDSFLADSIEETISEDSLRAALRDLDALNQASIEEGFEPCSELAEANARRIVEELVPRYPHSYLVFPTEDREVAIQASGPRGTVLILCESDGRGACFVSIGKKNKRARYDDGGDIPDAFVLEALSSLS